MVAPESPSVQFNPSPFTFPDVLISAQVFKSISKISRAYSLPQPYPPSQEQQESVTIKSERLSAAAHAQSVQETRLL
jgi:hypothetical protein